MSNRTHTPTLDQEQCFDAAEQIREIKWELVEQLKALRAIANGLNDAEAVTKYVVPLFALTTSDHEYPELKRDSLDDWIESLEKRAVEFIEWMLTEPVNGEE